MSNFGNPFTKLALDFINYYKSCVIYWDLNKRPERGTYLYNMVKSRIKADIYYRDLLNNTNEPFDGVVPPELLRRTSVMLSNRLKKLDKRYSISFGLIKHEELNHFLKHIEYRYVIQIQDTSSGVLLVNTPIEKIEELYCEEVAILFEEAASQMA